MTLFPVHYEAGKKKTWIASLLRIFGGVICVGTAITAAAFLYSYMELACIFFGVWGKTKEFLSYFFAVFLGIWLGIFASLPMWAFAMVLDDIHAIRNYVAGYSSVDEANVKNLPKA